MHYRLEEEVYLWMAPLAGGGHSSAILDLFDCIIIATDRDVNSVPIAKKLNEKYQDRINFYHASYTQIPSLLDSLSIKAVDGLLLDLGASSMQIDDPKRGFSFQNEGPWICGWEKM